MANYILELGLDLNAAPRSKGTSPLFSSLVDKENNQPAWLTNLKEGDTFEFHFFDYTHAPGPNPNSGLKIEGFVVSIVFADNPKNLIPIEPPQSLCYAHQVIQYSSEISSAVFLNIKSGWHLVNESNHPLVFTLPEGYTEKAVLKVEVICRVRVDATLEMRIYDHDPEIIVGPGT